MLIEYLNFFAEQGPHWRQRALQMIDAIAQNPSIEIVPFEPHTTFQSGLSLYAARRDKGYSMTDCISMRVLENLGVHEVLTQDHHFAQEGFTLLLRA